MKKDPNRIIEYTMNAKTVRRRIGNRAVPPTVKELAAQKKLSLVTTFLSHVKHYVRKGFELEGRLNNKAPNLLARSYNYHLITQGEYPDIVINFARAKLAIGEMPVTSNMAVKLHPLGLEFTWNPVNNQPGCLPGDQAMLLAYFPEKKYGVELINGSLRKTGSHILPLPGSALPLHVHVYISFIAADHYSISDSTYLGHLIWQKS